MHAEGAATRQLNCLSATAALASGVTDPGSHEELLSRPVLERRRSVRIGIGVAALLAASVVAPFGVAVNADAVEPAGIVIEDGFEISTTELSFGSADTGASARTAASSIALANAPEMLIIDTGGAVASFALRSSNDGVWGDWIGVETPLDEAPDGRPGEEGAGRASAIGPIWLGDGADRVEVVLVDGGAERVIVESLRSTMTVDPSASDPPGGTAARDSFGFSTAAPRPMIQPRSSWATRGWRSEHNGCDGGPFLANNIRSIVVHHTVTTNNYAASQVDDILRGIYRTHTDVNGWCDIAYNFVVDRFGTIWEARSGGTDLPIIGGHAKGFNTWTSGVAVLGNHHTAGAPTAASVAAVEALAAWKLSLHGVDPLGVNWLQNRSSTPPHRFAERAWVEMPAIVGHRDLGLTACPGSLLYPSLPGMRQALAPDHVTASPHVPVGRNPAEFGPALLTVESTGGLRSAGAAWSRAVDPLPDGRSAVAVGGRNNRGQLLDSTGRLTAFGGAVVISGQPAGSKPVVDLAMGADENRGWVLADDGRIYRFGGAVDRTASSRPAAGSAVAFALTSSGTGYVLDSSGGLHAVNGAPNRSIGSTVDAIDIALWNDGAGSDSGWVLDRSGRLHAFGDAPSWQPERNVAQARAVVAQGVYGGWVLDSEGRYVRFGDERRIQPISTTVGSPVAVDAAIVDWDTSLDADDMRYAAALRELFLGAVGDAREVDRLAHRALELGSPTVVSELAGSPEWAGALITTMYRDVLGRDPDPSGLAFWLDRLASGTRTQDVGAQFYSSPEYVEASGGTDAWLGRVYQALLDRAPDSSGVVYWRDRLSAGTGAYEVTSLFYSSPESRNRRVDDLYRQILGRAPEPGGQEFWADQLMQIDDIRLAVELATSREYYDRVTE